MVTYTPMDFSSTAILLLVFVEKTISTTTIADTSTQTAVNEFPNPFLNVDLAERRDPLDTFSEILTKIGGNCADFAANSTEMEDFIEILNKKINGSEQDESYPVKATFLTSLRRSFELRNVFIENSAEIVAFLENIETECRKFKRYLFKGYEFITRILAIEIGWKKSKINKEYDKLIDNLTHARKICLKLMKMLRTRNLSRICLSPGSTYLKEKLSRFQGLYSELNSKLLSEIGACETLRGELSDVRSAKQAIQEPPVPFTGPSALKKKLHDMRSPKKVKWATTRSFNQPSPLDNNNLTIETTV